MAKQPKEYWVKTTREMLASVKEVGAMPFVLYQYYLTYQNAKDGCFPSLETIATDLRILDKKGKPSKSAVCNLKKSLINAGWIREENGKILFPNHSEILNDETPDHSEKMNEDSEKMNEDSEILNEDSEKMNAPYIRIEKEELERKEKELERINEPADLGLTDENFSNDLDETLTWIQQQKSIKSRRNFPQSEWVDLLRDLEAEEIDLTKFREFYQWVANSDWMIERGLTVSPNIMRKQIENWKNRVIIQARKQNGAKNGNSNGTNGSSGANNAHLKPRLISDRN